MAANTHTRVYGGIKDWRPWLAACARERFTPDVLFTVGRKYVVATSLRGDFYMRRGPRGPLEFSRDPKFFGARLHKETGLAFRRHVNDVGNPPKVVRWQPAKYAEKDTTSVS